MAPDTHRAPPPPAYVLQPDTAEIRWMGRMGTQFLATGASTGDAFCLVDETAPARAEVPLHRHAGDVESFYVLAGEVTFYLGVAGGEAAGPGNFVHIPAGTVHGFRVTGDGTRYLILTTPRHGEFYRAISTPAAADRGPSGVPVNDGTIMEACGRFGVDYIGPLPG